MQFFAQVLNLPSVGRLSSYNKELAGSNSALSYQVVGSYIVYAAFFLRLGEIN